MYQEGEDGVENIESDNSGTNTLLRQFFVQHIFSIKEFTVIKLLGKLE